MAKMILFVLDDGAKTHAVLEAWARCGITGATLLDSSGIGRQLQASDALPLIPSLRSVLEQQEHTHRTIFSVVADAFDIPGLVKATEEIAGPMRDPHTGIFIVLPVMEVIGLRERLDG